MASSGTMVPWPAHATEMDHRAHALGTFNMTARPISQPTAPPPPTSTLVQVCADVKPRLTKDQHEILERHFQAQPKPSTSVKKGFADALGVPLDKINNWFQNRRAKVKQDAKKQLNAIQLFQATLAQHSQQYLAHPPQVSPQLPYHYGPLPVVPSNTDPVANASAPSHTDIAAVSTDAMQTTLPASRDGSFVPAMDFAMQAPPITSAPHALAFEAQAFGPADMPGQPMLLQDFNFGPTFSQDFVAMPEHFDLFMQNSGTVPMPMDSMHGHAALTPPSDSASPGAIPSLTSAYVHPSQCDDEKPRFIVDSPQEVADFSATTGHPTPADSTWSSVASAQDQYEQMGASATVLTISEGSPLSIDSFERRESSTLPESIHNIGIDSSSDGESSFKAPSEESSLAARRHKPRPANLMSSALRSASYTAGMPGSPGTNPNTNAPDHLRRIRSHGIGMNNGRITKLSAPQKSPMHANFDAAAIASPKFARHASNYSVSTVNSSGPLTATTMANSFAPPTPITPNEFTRFPMGQAPGFCYPNGSPGAFSHMGEDPIYLDTASPMAKLDIQQMEQYKANLVARHEASLFNTPPQSAPASQQHFGFTPPAMQPRLINGHSGLGHVRRPSLPDANNQDMNGHLQPQMLIHADQTMQPPFNPQLAEAFNADPNSFIVPQAIPGSEVPVQFMVPPPMKIVDSRLPVHFHNQTPEDFQNATRSK